MSDEKVMDELHVRDRIADVLMVLSAIGSGSTSERLTIDLPEDDPFAILYDGINEVVDSLVSGQQRLEAYQEELEAKLETIERQRNAIRELSTPVIEVWANVLCLPVVGVMDTSRSAEMTDALLRAVTEKKSRYTIIDVTGIEVMDTSTADHFIRMAKAVRLLGAECVLAGISPNIAQTIVHMGVDLSGVVTFRTMREALQYFVRASGDGANGRATKAKGNGALADAAT
jgi:rsbT co-antagonist protein RsbR